LSGYSIPPLLTFFFFLGLALLTLARGRPSTVHRVFALICGIGCLLNLDMVVAFNTASPATALWVSRLDHVLVVWLIPLYIHFFHLYLQRPVRPALLRGAYACAFGLMLLTPTDLYFAGVQRYHFGYFTRAGALYPLFALGAVVATTYALVLVHRAIVVETAALRRNSLRYVRAGFGLMGLLNVASLLPNFGVEIYPAGCLSFIPLTVFWVGLFRHDLLDMGVVIQKGLLYSILTGLVLGSYALVVTGAGYLLTDPVGSGAFGFHFVFFALVVVVFGPLRDKTQKLIDGVFARDKINYQKTLTEVSRLIVTIRDAQRIIAALIDVILNALKVGHCTVFLKDQRDAGFRAVGSHADRTIEAGAPFVKTLAPVCRPVSKKPLLDRRDDPRSALLIGAMEELAATVVLPLCFKEQLLGLIAIGDKRSGSLFSTEDLDLLETLANNAALALENANSYAALAELNQNLETEVHRRTGQLRQALDEKERTQEQLVRSESLAAIGQLVAGTAHELNNPLASTLSLIQSAVEDLSHAGRPEDEEMVDDLRFAEKEIQRARTIVSSLLGLSRQTQSYTEAVAINAVVADAVRILANRCKHLGVNVEVNYAADLPLVCGNFANLGQVALNVIGNAIDAVTPTRGTVYLSTAADPAGGGVVFTCRDTGPGIDAGIRKDVFNPFFTTKKPGAGTGLGLYICHEIVTRHNGTISCTTAEGGGALFEVRLPAGQAAGDGAN